MLKKSLIPLSICLLLGALVSVPAFAADDDEPKHTIKEVMKKAMKGPLTKKVAGGEASDEEKKLLHEMYEAMAAQKPKKGDEESWKKLTTALVAASKAAVDGDEKAPAMLKKAANCKACHKVHKPKKN